MCIYNVSVAWFPKYSKLLHAGIIGPCLHCGAGEARLIDNEFTEKLIGEYWGYHVGVRCSRCDITIEVRRQDMPNCSLMKKTDRERARTLVASLWNGRDAKPPLLSFGEWAYGTVFTGGRSPEWAQDDERQHL